MEQLGWPIHTCVNFFDFSCNHPVIETWMFVSSVFASSRFCFCSAWIKLTFPRFFWKGCGHVEGLVVDTPTVQAFWPSWYVVELPSWICAWLKICDSLGGLFHNPLNLSGSTRNHLEPIRICSVFFQIRMAEIGPKFQVGFRSSHSDPIWSHLIRKIPQILTRMV